MFDDPTTPSVPPQAWVVVPVASAGAFEASRPNASAPKRFAGRRGRARRPLRGEPRRVAVSTSGHRLRARDARLLRLARGDASAEAVEDRRAADRARWARRDAPVRARRARGERADELRAELLDAVLALDEAVVFRFDEQGALAQAARLRSQAQGASANATVSGERHSAWREGVGLCERAVASRELTVEETSGGARSSVAAPLVHEGSAVGALLLRLRERFTRRTRRSCRTCARSSRATYSGRTRACPTHPKTPRELLLLARGEAASLSLWRRLGATH